MIVREKKEKRWEKKEGGALNKKRGN